MNLLDSHPVAAAEDHLSNGGAPKRIGFGARFGALVKRMVDCCIESNLSSAVILDDSREIVALNLFRSAAKHRWPIHPSSHHRG